ncbi:MAG: sigma-54-dependent Fis family transcriptional regulator [Planctomycetales bacterium]|nr:sigma-54-dependent Fis family transcriptional regulator [Planctomycetales bacterium]
MQQFHLSQTELDVADKIIGNSTWTSELRKRVRQVANFRYSVLVTGPSGTGKELVAREIHAHSDRVAKPFIPVNCAAIPGELFCSQLFGHEKGAFTGAQYASLGCFRAADGGTIFLDEIGDLDLDSQAKLLRVLQERRVTPVGSHVDIPVDVRTIAATNRNLAVEVQAGRFRLDLYYRLNVLSVETLGLAARTEDIEPLANYFLAKAAVESGLPFRTLSPEALALLQRYQWPGNVRELQNYVERAVVMSEDDDIDAVTIASILGSSCEAQASVLAGGLTSSVTAPPLQLRVHAGDPVESVMKVEPTDASSAMAEPVPMVDGDIDDDAWLTLAEMEERHLRRTLKRTYYNQSAAARLLGIDRKLLARKIKKFGIMLPSR